MAKKMPAGQFVSALEAALKRGDGYIMGATGQDPKKWSESSWWFSQYSGKQREKALYWRAHAARVWDCNGLAEGLYRDYSGSDINTQARYNYSGWCGLKGAGTIPAKYRTPGAAVFWGTSPGNIHHVAYLEAPLDAGNPAGDWYLIEARGVLYGVVRTRLSQRKPDYWGWMDKYFEYGAAPAQGVSAGPRHLKNGMSGADVREMQAALIRLGYDLGRWGADGEFGDATELAVRAFQRAEGLTEDGVFGPRSREAADRALAALERAVEAPERVVIEGGDCYVRQGPSAAEKILGVARRGESLPFRGQRSEAGWLKVARGDAEGWVSGRYGRLVEA